MSNYNTSSPQQQPQPPARYSGGSTDGGGGIEEGEGEEVVEYKHQLPPMQPYILGEDEKIPLFLVKMWNIVEDPANFDVIRWDDSGYSFHITDPYSFCRNVLPQFFKHNNLNSLIRQLNMYGFRKMTPIERTSLARAESDQDHLEFSHPFFVRDHPELLINIKRKVTNSKQHEQQAVLAAAKDTATTAPSKDLTAVYEELHHLRERQKIMETKMSDLVKENELIWREMDHMRGAHFKQQQIVNKLVQFLVALVHPANKQQRLGKRQLLAIDERAVGSKRSRAATGSWERGLGEHAGQDRSHGTTLTQQNTTEMLDQLMEELGREQMLASGVAGMPPAVVRPKRPDSGSSGGSVSGPIIAEVTDEFDQLPGGSTLAQQQAQPLYSAYVDNINRQRQQPKPRYPTRVTRNYPGVKGGTQAQPRGGAAIGQEQLNPPLNYLPSQSKEAPNTGSPQLIMPFSPNNASEQQSMQSAPRYFTRQYQQQQQLQQPQQPIHQGQSIRYRNSGIPTIQLISPPSVPAAQRSQPSIPSPHSTFPIDTTQQQQPAPLVVTANTTVPPLYSPVSPSVNTAMGMGANTAYSADQLMVPTIQPETTSSITANDGEKPAGTELTEDEFNEYLNQNDMAINNLRGQFGNIWDFDSLFDLEDPDHPQVITDAGEKSRAGSPYFATENGNERPAALSPLSNVPTETLVRSCTKTRKN